MRECRTGPPRSKRAARLDARARGAGRPATTMAEMTDTWRRRLDAGHALLTDGGTGSELRRRGFALRPDAWSAPASLTHFGLLRGIHADYVEAGADVITTHTFPAAPFVPDAARPGPRPAHALRRPAAAPRARAAPADGA